MRHEKFEIFKVQAADINSDDVVVFLNAGHIIPKSISVDKYYNNQKLILIGYIERHSNETQHTYELIEKEIDISFHGLQGIGDLISAAALGLGGVVCQDIEYIGEMIRVTFLVTNGIK